VTSKPDFKVMVLLLLLVFMQLTRDLFAIAKFLFQDLGRRISQVSDDSREASYLSQCIAVITMS